MVMTPTQGPCEPWCTTDDLRCGVQTGSPMWTDAEYIGIASDVLFALSGHRFPGECTKTEYPTAETWRPTSVRLDTPWRVTAITSVYVDGALVSPLLYEVHDWRYLVRLRDANGSNPGWPTEQTPDLAGGTGSFRVTYTHGEEVPTLGRLAAATLACSLKQLWCNQPALTMVQAKQQAIRAALDTDIVATFLRTYPQAPSVGVWTPEQGMGVLHTWP